MGFGYQAEQKLRELDAALLPERFVRFVYDAADLDLAVDLLVFCQTAKSCSEVDSHCIAYRVDATRSRDVLEFVTEQHLVIIDKGKFKAIDKAIDELIYRLEHDGQPSPREPLADPYECKRQQARDKVDKTLRAKGYRTTANQLRLRVLVEQR